MNLRGWEWRQNLLGYPDFHYPPLNSETSFRVLIIEPGAPGEALCCRLEEVPSPLLETERYEALSYAWGDETSSDLVFIAGGSNFGDGYSILYIKPNLFDALQMLRLRDEERRIWIDAICINQDDLKERASQVLLMREIYANASQVLIWLGNEEDDDEHTFKALEQISTQIHGLEDDVEGDTADYSLYTSEHLPTTEMFNNISSLLQRPWFRRTWVVQEVASAQKVVFMYGSSMISWEAVSKAIMTLRRSPLPTMTFEESAKIQHPEENVFAMEMARRSTNGTFPLSLFELLLATCFNQCSDPRDKLYAVLGLAKDWQGKGELTPDYRPDITPEKVFQRFAMWDIQKNQTLRILSCATENGYPSNLPSWVPDWRAIKNPDPFLRYSTRTKFSAATTMPLRIWFSDHGQVLNVVGEVVDAIKRIGPEPKFCRIITTFMMEQPNISRAKATQEWLQACQKQASDTNGKMTRKRFEEFWRTMTCGLTADGHPVPAEYGGHFEKYVDFLKHNITEIKVSSGESKEWRDSGMVIGIGEDHPNWKRFALIESSLEKWSSRRRLCTTSKGGLASVPPKAQDGDLICIIYGGEVPYVLRPHAPGVYTLVGECYVDGIMHGEALSHGGVRAKDFRLF